LRNLRNMKNAGVNDMLIRDALRNINADRVLPFRFISAARHAPSLEAELEDGMFKCLEGHAKLPGKTMLLIDVSGSMDWKISDKSDISRIDTACGLAMLLREICDTVEVHTFSTAVREVAPRRGFALAEAINRSQHHGGTNLGHAVKTVNGINCDRLIVITDEQSSSRVPDPVCKKSYMINVASYKNGVGYGRWTHIDGWSDSIVTYIQALENTH